jgi:DNA invertase Pin-like site-specific DNA recombinase
MRGQSIVSVAAADLVGFLGELNAAGCDLYSSGRPSILRGQRARLSQMLGVFAEFEREIIKDRPHGCVFF